MNNHLSKHFIPFLSKFDPIIIGPVFYNLMCSCCLRSIDNSLISVDRSCGQSSLMLQGNAVKSSQDGIQKFILLSNHVTRVHLWYRH